MHPFWRSPVCREQMLVLSNVRAPFWTLYVSIQDMRLIKKVTSFNLPIKKKKKKSSFISDYLPRAQGECYHLTGYSETFGDHADFKAIKIQGSFQYQAVTENCGPNPKHPQSKFPMAQRQIPIWHLPSSELLNHTKIIFTYCNHAVGQKPLFRS